MLIIKLNVIHRYMRHINLIYKFSFVLEVNSKVIIPIKPGSLS